MKLTGIKLGELMMQIFKRKSKAVKELTRVQRRVKTLPSSELVMWTDQIR